MVSYRSRVLRQFAMQRIAVATLFITSLAAATAHIRAAGLVEQAHSLRAVPEDAAFYSASLRLKEQLDIFLNSKTYQRLMEIPVLQLAKMQPCCSCSWI
jgi:hypothetical protein